MLLEVKDFSDFGLHTMLVAVVGCCSEAYTKLLFNKVCENFWLFKHQPVRFINQYQRVFLWFKVKPSVVFNFTLGLSQPPQILKILFVSLHKVLIVEDQVDFCEHSRFESYQSRRGHNPGLAFARVNTPQLLFRLSGKSNAVLRETKLFLVRFVLSFVDN